MYQYNLPETVKGHTNTAFANPFFDLASQYVPRDIKSSFRWAEYLYCVNPTYAAAVNRIARYLITDLDLTGQHSRVISRYNLLFEKMKIKRTLALFGITYLVYGNAFMSVSLPFDRILRCPKCGGERPSKTVDYTFADYKFNAKCPCGFYGSMTRVDKRSEDVSRTNAVIWDPKLMEINRSITGECEYIIHLDPLLKYKIQQKNKFIIDTTPWEFVHAIRRDQVFKFADDAIIHMANETLPGFNIEWGLPPAVNLFRLHYQAALMRRANEAISLDYIVPLRVLFPQSGSAQSDAVSMMGLGKWRGHIENMIRRHRLDPTWIQTSPVPLGYQAVGGEGKALNLTPEIKSVNEELLNGAGFPAELFYGTLHVQAIPAALRLFENIWDHLYYGYNMAVQFIADKVSRYFGWPAITAKLQRITLADDIERRQILMQIAASGQGSQDSFFKAYGLDWKSETTKMIREQIELPEIQKQISDEYKMQQNLEQDAGGGATPMDRTVEAQQLAQQVVSDPVNSKQLLNQLSQADEQLYALVKMYADRIRSQMSSQAGREALQQGMMAAGPGGVTGSGAEPMPPAMPMG